MTANELRRRYIDFFVQKGHLHLPSAPLIPHGDPTLLLTGAGMVPFKPYFLGQAEPPRRRITTYQRCLRTPDIDNVGKTDRHATFFEMLGNFSFGDYFKREAIHWAWEFVTQHLSLPPEKLWVTIYQDDDEAFAIWNDEVGVPAEKIVRLGRKDNFWEIGVGPCGPCSEIHVDRGPAFGCGHEDCRPGCDRCQRFLEIWNLVFIQFHQDAEGRLTPLAQKGIDTGMGLERTAALLQGARSIFEIDLVRPIVDAIATRAGVPYGREEVKDVSIRVITDHIRGVTFMVADGILPSNEGRGYVLRRLLRRAVRHARLLGIEGPFLADLVEVVVDQMRFGYPEVAEKAAYVKRVVSLEEERFQETLEQGMGILRNRMAELAEAGRRVIPGVEAFRLHDTYGFPLELTEEIARENGFAVDREGFEQAMERQREQARAARAEMGYLGTAGVSQLADAVTRFVGYDQLVAEAEVTGLAVEGERVARATAGQTVAVLLDVTPFYPEGGGQVADTGTLTAPGGLVAVDRVERLGEGLIVHYGRVVSGEVGVGERVLATVDEEARRNTARNHTATHLLHQALHDLLGEHANQAGSLVAPDRLRFDFTHFQAVDARQLEEIEGLVNEKILANLPVEASVMDLDEARRLGARALFGEKYGQRVRVVSIDGYSRELCGGTHVRSTGELGLFKIVAEGGVAAGVRRVEAVTGRGTLQFVREMEGRLAQVAGRLSTSPREVPQQVEKVLAQLRQTERELAQLKARLAALQSEALVAQAEQVGGLWVLVARVDARDTADLRQLGDQLRDRLGRAVIVLGTTAGERAQVLAVATPEAVQRGIDAGQVVREVAPLLGGRGGGRPERGEGGGSRPEGLTDGLALARSVIERQLAAARRT